MAVGLRERTNGRYVPVYLLAGVAAILVYFQLPSDTAQALLYDSLVTSGAIAIAIGVARHKPEARAGLLWYLAAASVAFLAAGDITYDIYALVKHVDPVPVPSWADFFYLAGYPFLLVAMWGMARRRLPSSKFDTLLDAAVIGLGAAIGVGGPLLSANTGDHRSLAAIFVATTYPILDVATLAAASFLVLQRGLRNPATQLLVASLLSLTIGDVVFAYLGASGYDVGAGVDVTWLAHAVLLGAAALHPAMKDVLSLPRQRTTSLGAVRAGIIGMALFPLVLGRVSGDVPETFRVLGVPLRVLLVAVVLFRLMRLSRETELAHDRADARAASLQRAREEIAHIVSGAADAIIGGAIDGTITMWNSGAEELLGVRAADAIGTPIANFVAEDIGPWAEAFNNMMPGDIRSAVLPAIRADGVAVLVDVRLGSATTRDGQIMGWVAIARDASEALVARTAGASGELDPATVLDNVQTIVGRVVGVAAVGLVSFDLEQEKYREVLTVGSQVAIHLPDEGSLSADALARLHDQPTVFSARFDAPALRPITAFLDRARAHYCVAVTIRHATLGPLGLLLIALDVEDTPSESVVETIRTLVPSLTRVARSLMLAEEEQTSARRTAEIDSMRSEFSDFVRNDMREQVAAIRSAVNVLSDTKIALGDSWRERLLTGLSQSVDSLEQLVGNVATAGLVVDGRFPCELRRIDDLGGVIRRTVDKAQCHIKQPINLVIADLPPVKGDAERLGEVIGHLLTNAAKFSPATESIGVSATYDSMTRRVRIAVRDRGIGIAPEDHALVFRRFSRLVRDASARPEGTGLGLFIAQGIVESHGGRISLTSQLGEGSVFYIELPAEQPAVVGAAR